MKLNFKLLTLLLCVSLHAKADCYGQLINPATEICWSCLFPITVGKTTIEGSGDGLDTSNPSKANCKCPGSPFPRYGIHLGFWEPARIVDVTRTPYCFVSLGGLQLSEGGQQGTLKTYFGQSRRSEYHVHVYRYPILSLLDLGLESCSEHGRFQLLYASELDPTWLDDELSFLFNPEAALVGNLVSQSACAADCTAASSSFPIDDLYWCAGCQGSMFPVTGHVAKHVSNVQASLLMVQRSFFRLHREFSSVMPGTMGEDAMCGYYRMPTMQKSQYKTQMVYPKNANDSSSFTCNPFGKSSVLWESFKSYPMEGEDFSYVIWRKRNCCAS